MQLQSVVSHTGSSVRLDNAQTAKTPFSKSHGNKQSTGFNNQFVKFCNRIMKAMYVKPLTPTNFPASLRFPSDSFLRFIVCF